MTDEIKLLFDLLYTKGIVTGGRIYYPERELRPLLAAVQQAVTENKGDDFDAFVRNEGLEFSAAVDARYSELVAEQHVVTVDDAMV